MNAQNLVAFLVILGTLFPVSACSGGGSSSSNPNQGIAMELNLEYVVMAGDLVLPRDDETRIAVRHIYE